MQALHEFIVQRLKINDLEKADNYATFSTYHVLANTTSSEERRILDILPQIDYLDHTSLVKSNKGPLFSRRIDDDTENIGSDWSFDHKQT